MDCKIILLFPNLYLFEKFSAIPHQPSLSLGYLAGSLEKNSISYDIIDAYAENLSLNQIIERIKKIQPIFIGITMNIAIAYAAIVHALKIKKYFPNIKIIVGGPWATAEYNYIIKKRYADYVIIGEGEKNLVELLNSDLNDKKQLSSIPGICFRLGHEVIFTQKNNHIENLDELPFPSWKKFPKKTYTRPAREKPMFPFITSRGCPYNCINCTKIIHGFKMRYRSIDNMLEELDYLKTLGAKEIAIEDDMFNLDLKRTKAFLLAVIKRKYNFHFQLSNGIRADKIDRSFARLLYAAGVYRVALGVESGSQKVVNFLNKQLNLEFVPRSVKILQEAHLKVLGYFIMGLPIENYQSLLHSVAFAIKSNFDIMVFLKLVVFPGTKLHDYVISHTNYPRNTPIIHQTMNYHYTPLQFSTPNLNNRILKKVNNYYLIQLFLNPRRFLRFLASFTIMGMIEQISRNIQILLKRFFLQISFSN